MAADRKEEPLTSNEQGQISLIDAFDSENRQWRLEKRRQAIEDTKFNINFRSYYFDRRKYDGTESLAFTVGGWAGFKTGYFLDHVAFGVMGYTSQPLFAPDEKDGTQLLKTGQEDIVVLGQAYVDIRIVDDLNLYVGRKEFDTPYLNRDDSRMVPITFEAIALMGKIKMQDDAILKYGAGYFDRIKERNSDRFISMSEDAGADVSRGVFTAGTVYQKGDLSIGGIDYYCPDVINIAYAEAKIGIPISESWRPKLALQFTDQRSVGSDSLQESAFSSQQVGVKAELPWKDALFTGGYTYVTDGNNMQTPWSSSPGYTAVQVEDFDRAGEGAFLLRAAYKIKPIDGLSVYTLWVHGNTDPEGVDQFRRDEVDFNVEWAPTEGKLKGFGLRVRYGRVKQHGGAVNDLDDFRVICNYAVNF
ncbi:hypothetical protein AYO49_02085 [Verrucomicrobiaceae bacterium SCGC AG-212-N21]|nr:hypothetical protein AYO49_02085 [Verrucomicrobiaceae bacterium SCGC AG-212-N21]